MGMFDLGWGHKDETSKDERDSWRDNAKEQAGLKSNKDKAPKENPRHAAKRGLWG